MHCQVENACHERTGSAGWCLIQDLPGLMTLVATVIDVRPYINFPLTPVSSSTHTFLVFYIYREWLVTTHYHEFIIRHRTLKQYHSCGNVRNDSHRRNLLWNLSVVVEESRRSCKLKNTAILNNMVFEAGCILVFVYVMLMFNSKLILHR